MNKKRIIAAVLAVVLCAALGAGAWAAARAKKVADSRSESLFLSRIDARIEPAEFTVASAGECALDFTLTVKKNEPDFYARVDSVAVEGLNVGTLTVTPDPGNPGGSAINGLELSAGEEGPFEYRFSVSAAVSADKLPARAKLVLYVTSGLTYSSASSSRVELGLTLTEGN
ncbi:MAG: hypothetical protein K6C36_07655 [Clostridia bacterium]|nr:hypothetical protein [Clostridia bacterium]